MGKTKNTTDTFPLRAYLNQAVDAAVDGGQTKAEIATAAGLTKQHLNCMLHGDGNRGLSSTKNIGRVLAVCGYRLDLVRLPDEKADARKST